MAYTLERIGRMAGVSRATVSLVLNNSPRVSAKTRDKVLAVCRACGYEQNFFARNLASKRPLVIGLLVSNLLHAGPGARPDVNLEDMLGGIRRALGRKRIRLVVHTLPEEESEERSYLAIFREKLVSGYLVWGAFSDDAFLEDLVAEKVPFVLLGARSERHHFAAPDEASGMAGAVEHLIGLGRERIAFVGGPGRVPSASDRRAGVLRALTAHKIPPRSAWLREGDFCAESGLRETRALLKTRPRPTAIVAVNDETAVGALRAVREAGLSVPEDVAVVGADNVRWGNYTEPPLTTVEPPHLAVAEAAARGLVALIEGETDTVAELLPMRLVVRASTAGA